METKKTATEQIKLTLKGNFLMDRPVGMGGWTCNIPNNDL